MSTKPRITVVTPSFNQARVIGETIASVRTQDYPNLEHIIVDGGSTDGTREILARTPNLQVICEPDHGQADAINKGFRQATGDIFSFLNSDDTLAPGALRRVADEFAAAPHCQVVMGRCCFMDEHSRPTGIEHPCFFTSHRRVLEIWKGHGIPQPSVFWTRAAWERCGPMNTTLWCAWIDYDFFCRLSRAHSFQVVDQVLSNYRLHPESKTGGSSEEQRLAESIGISRKYWGPWYRPRHLALAFSLARHRFNRFGRARNCLLAARQYATAGHWTRAAVFIGLGCALAPVVSLRYALYAMPHNRSIRALRRLVLQCGRGRPTPFTSVYANYHDLWTDQWAGPKLTLVRNASTAPQTLLIRGVADIDLLGEALRLRIGVAGHVLEESCVRQNGPFEFRVPLPPGIEPGPVAIEINANTSFVINNILRNGDTRPLAWKVAEIGFVR